MAEANRQPGDDREIAPGAEVTVLKSIRECKAEAEAARKSRMKRNIVNMNAFHGKQDWTHKQEGQSREFLPKIPMSVEQISAFIKKALVGFGDWFTVETGKDVRKIFSGYDIQNLLKIGLEEHNDFATTVADAVKVGVLESLIVLKVYGKRTAEKEFFVEEGIKMVSTTFQGNEVTVPQTAPVVKERDIDKWRLAIDLIDVRDYYPDPTGNKLYEIHSVERDLHEVVAIADEGFYDADVVNTIQESHRKMEEEHRIAMERGQDVAAPPSFRKKIVLDEFWGTMLDSNGRVAERNVVATMANGKYLIRPPIQNPNWHRESPFVASPLIRVPFSVWHKALLDHGVNLNFALNELFNLMLDGGISSVWGIKQLRIGDLEDPRQVSGGIRQGMTLAVKEGTPANSKVVETVATGEVPRDALATYHMVDREYQAASMTDDLKLGMLPPKQVKATEVLQAAQSSDIFFGGVASDLERNLLAPTLKKAWGVMLQNSDDLDSGCIVNALSKKAALTFIRLTPEERFVMLWQGCNFKVSGISTIMGKTKDFQKLMALLQATGSNPLLLRAFIKKYSADKILLQIIKTLNINPDNITNSEEEMLAIPETLTDVQMLMGMLNLGAKGGSEAKTSPANTIGESELPAEINQMGRPTGGF